MDYFIILEAKKIGLTVEEIRNFLHDKSWRIQKRSINKQLRPTHTFNTLSYIQFIFFTVLNFRHKRLISSYI